MTLNPASNSVFRFATVSGQTFHWFLRRNCAISPKQLLMVYAMLVTVSMGIALFFWVQGAFLVMPFACLELLAVGIAFLAYARHATDGEQISLQGSRLVVELETSGRRVRSEFNRDWVRVEPQAGDESLIELSGQGKKVQVGRYVRPELRAMLAREIRLALRTA
jgi:uncharacterized membrane protein